MHPGATNAVRNGHVSLIVVGVECDCGSSIGSKAARDDGSVIRLVGHRGVGIDRKLAGR